MTSDMVTKIFLMTDDDQRQHGTFCRIGESAIFCGKGNLQKVAGIGGVEILQVKTGVQQSRRQVGQIAGGKVPRRIRGENLPRK